MAEAFNPIEAINKIHTPAEDSAIQRLLTQVVEVPASEANVGGITVKKGAGLTVSDEAKSRFQTIKDANDKITALKAQKDIKPDDLTGAIDKVKEKLKADLGGHDLSHAGDMHQTALASIKHDAEHALVEHGARRSAVRSSEAFGNHSKEEQAAIVKALDKEAEELRKRGDVVKKFASEHEPHVSAMTGVEAKTITAEAGALAEGGKLFKGMPQAAKIGVIGEAEYAKKTNFVSKLMADAKAKVNVASIDKHGAITESKFLGKMTKVAGAGVGTVISAYGLKDLGQVMGVIGADTDEKGQEIPADGGKLFKAAAELAGGAGIVYLSVIRGGRDLAKGIGK